MHRGINYGQPPVCDAHARVKEVMCMPQHAHAHVRAHTHTSISDVCGLVERKRLQVTFSVHNKEAPEE